MSTTLSSWKEIAAYLGKGVRTVQRWETQFALPVRRPNAKSHIIFAVPAELDAWVKHQHSRGTLTTQVTMRTRRMEQDKLIKLLEERVSRLQANRQALGSNVTRLKARIEGLRRENGTAEEKPTPRQSAGRGAA